MRKALLDARFGRTERARLWLLAGMRQRSDAVIACVGSNPRGLEITLTLRALTGHLAVEASALDLRLIEDRRSLDAIRAGMDEYAVLMFRDQRFLSTSSAGRFPKGGSYCAILSSTQPSRTSSIGMPLARRRVKC